MPKKGNLFKLIKSLNKSEKRYFKRYCFNQGVGKNYIKLFDVLDQLNMPNEQKVKDAFQGEAFTKQLHVTKNYLFHLICKSLRSYHSKISKNAELKDCLRNIEIFYRKELYDLCRSEILRGEKMAQAFEKQTALIELLGWKRRLLLNEKGLQREELNELLQAEKKQVLQLKRISDYWDLTANIFDYINDEGKLLELPCMENHNENNSLEGKVLHFHILYTYFTINEQPDKGIEKLTELIQYYEGQPDRIAEEPGSYITALTNKISALIFKRAFSDALPIIEKVRAIPTIYKLKLNNQLRLAVYLRTYNMELEIYRDTNDWPKGKYLIKEIDQFLNKNKKLIREQYLLQLWYQFAYIYFMSNSFSDALKWVNEILNVNFRSIRVDLQSYIRILNLMVHFEMGNIFVLKYAVDNCRRFLKKKEKIEPFEQKLLRFFSKVSRIPERQYAESFSQLYKELFIDNPNMVSASVLDYLDFKAWIERHL